MNVLYLIFFNYCYEFDFKAYFDFLFALKNTVLILKSKKKKNMFLQNHI